MKFSYGKILGVDLGIKKTGLAISDERWTTIRLLPNLIPKSRMKDIDYLLKLCSLLDIQFILIGYPTLPESSNEGMMAKRARGFYETIGLHACKKLRIFLIDEIYTSLDAKKRLKTKKLHLNLLDGESARILIETFIENQLALLCD